MVAYAVASGISDIGLIYPALPFEPINKELPVYEIKDEFTSDKVIRIHPFKVDIVHSEGLNLVVSTKLELLFEETNQNLIIQLNNVIEKIVSSKTLDVKS